MLHMASYFLSCLCGSELCSFRGFPVLPFLSCLCGSELEAGVRA